MRANERRDEREARSSDLDSWTTILYLLAMLSRDLSLPLSPVLSPGAESRLSSDKSDIRETSEEATAEGVDRPLPLPPTPPTSAPPEEVGVEPDQRGKSSSSSSSSL